LTPEILTPGQTTLAQLEQLYRAESAAELPPSARKGIDAAAARIAAAAAGDTAVYGVNTGFGKLASLKIARQDTATLQKNLILSHCCGVGDAMPRPVTRLMMALKLLSLGRGASGVRWDVVALLQDMLARGVTPVIPAQGSVGASGDLAPLAHMAAAMIGHGEAEFDGNILPSMDALKFAGLTPVVLGPKEGLALINGTQFSTAYALVGLWGGWRAAQSALVTPSWGPQRRYTPKFTRCAAMQGRSRRRQPCAPFLLGPSSAKAIWKVTTACRTPIASAASRR
jgi:histidine ammonia-lyase